MLTELSNTLIHYLCFFIIFVVIGKNPVIIELLSYFIKIDNLSFDFLIVINELSNEIV